MHVLIETKYDLKNETKHDKLKKNKSNAMRVRNLVLYQLSVFFATGECL